MKITRRRITIRKIEIARTLPIDHDGDQPEHCPLCKSPLNRTAAAGLAFGQPICGKLNAKPDGNPEIEKHKE